VTKKDIKVCGPKEPGRHTHTHRHTHNIFPCHENVDDDDDIFWYCSLHCCAFTTVILEWRTCYRMLTRAHTHTLSHAQAGTHTLTSTRMCDRRELLRHFWPKPLVSASKKREKERAEFSPSHFQLYFLFNFLTFIYQMHLLWFYLINFLLCVWTQNTTLAHTVHFETTHSKSLRCRNFSQCFGLGRLWICFSIFKYLQSRLQRTQHTRYVVPSPVGLELNLNASEMLTSSFESTAKISTELFLGVGGARETKERL